MQFKDFGATEFKPATLDDLQQWLAGLDELSTPRSAQVGRLPRGRLTIFSALRDARDEALAHLSAAQKGGLCCVAIGTRKGLWSLLHRHRGIDEKRLAFLVAARPLEALAAAEILVASQRIDLVLLGPLDDDWEVSNRLDSLGEQIRGGRTAVLALGAAPHGSVTRGTTGLEKAVAGYGLDDLSDEDVVDDLKYAYKYEFKSGRLEYEKEEAVADFPPVLGHLPLSKGADDDDAEDEALPPSPAPPARSLNTWFEGAQEPLLPLRVGEEYDLKFQIGRRRAETPGGGVTPFAEPDFGRHQGLDLLTTLYSSDFRIAQRSHTFWLPKDGDAEIQETRVVPLHPGLLKLRLVISLRRELEVLQTAVVEVEARAARGGG